MATSGISVSVRQWRDREIVVEPDDDTPFVLDFDGTCSIAFSSHFTRGSRRAPRLELSGDRSAAAIGRGARGLYELFGTSAERGRYGKVERLVQVGDPAPPGSPMTELVNDVVAGTIDLADCIPEDREPRISAEHAWYVVEIIEQVCASARLRRRLDLTTSFRGTDVHRGTGSRPVSVARRSRRHRW